MFAIFPLTAQSEDEGFRSKHFLEMPDVHKKFWLTGAMESLAYAAASKSEDKGRCVYNWYFSERLAERNSLILATMEHYSHATPSAVLVALIKEDCGDFLSL